MPEPGFSAIKPAVSHSRQMHDMVKLSQAAAKKSGTAWVGHAPLGVIVEVGGGV